MKRTVLATIHLDPEDATIDEAARVLGVPLSHIDKKFGLMRVSRKQGKYAVRLRTAVDPKILSERGAVIDSDPAIRAFG